MSGRIELRYVSGREHRPGCEDKQIYEFSKLTIWLFLHLDFAAEMIGMFTINCLTNNSALSL